MNEPDLLEDVPGLDAPDAPAQAPAAVKSPPDVVIELAGPPRGKGRPRTRVVTAPGKAPFATVYTDAETRNYEAMLRYQGEQQMKGAAPFDCALKVIVRSYFPIPASFSIKKKEQAEQGLIRPVVKPDWENLAKTLDGLNGIVWRDDSLVVHGVVHKWYSLRPRLRIEVTKWQPNLLV